MKILTNFLFVFVFISVFSCENKEDLNTLTVSAETITIPAEGGTTNFSFETNAESWSIDNPAADWIALSTTSGTNQKALVVINVVSKTLEPRADTLIINAGNAKPVPVIVSQASSTYIYDLTPNVTFANFNFTAGKVALEIASDAPEWQLTSDADWISFSESVGSAGTKKVYIFATANPETTQRTTTLVLSGSGAPETQILVTQKGGYPSYNTNPLEPDNTGMASNAVALAGKLKIGWNIGNTLEAMGGETAWGNPLVTEELIQLVKANGFNAIRIPCSWNQYLENAATAKIKTQWLERVKQVVSYCVDNDMYVVLNIHWDGGWLENNCTTDKQEENNAKQKAFWEQIATQMRDFDEHLLFASANEPNVENSTEMKVLLSYHQTFIDAVRSTGGKNSYRVLVVQGPATDIEKTNSLMNTLPTDEIADRMMVEIHYYTPYQFCLMSEDATWGNMFYYWGADYHSTTDTERNATWGEEAAMTNFFGLMKSKFVVKGIPVIMGEFAVIRRSTLTGEDLDLHLASRAFYLKYLAQQANANGIIPFYWDAGNMGNNASALFNRQNNTVYDQEALDALMQGIGN